MKLLTTSFAKLSWELDEAMKVETFRQPWSALQLEIFHVELISEVEISTKKNKGLEVHPLRASFCWENYANPLFEWEESPWP